jgi:hypothetical protein
LELARHEDDPDVGAAARVERSLSKRMALGAALATGSAAVSKSAVGAGLLATAGKSAIVAGVATTLVFTGWETLHQQPSAPEARPPAMVAAPSGGHPRGAVAPRSTSTPARANGASPAPNAPSPLAVSPPEVRRPGLPRAVPVRTGYARDQQEPTPAAIAAAPPERLLPAPPDRLAIETQELRGAQQALRAGDNERALALLEQQDARHPSGALAQERQAARVLALCQSQQLAQARREAERFEARFPESPLLAKVRGACRGR